MGRIFPLTHRKKKPRAKYPRRRPRTGSQSCYIISDGSACKIGTSAAPEHRLAELQTGNPRPMSLLGVLPGGQHTEKVLHRWLKEKRISGEWFGLTDEQGRQVAEIMVTALHGLQRVAEGEG